MAEFQVRLCNVRRCLTRVPVPRLFCGRHWCFVPTWLQEEIAAAWNANPVDLEVLLSRARNVISTTERQAPTY
jgi:hypothetical protein